MPDRARVTSLEAIESFRTNLILFVSKARPALEDVSADVLRVRLWLEDEQRIHWENQVRRRTKVLEQAQQAHSSARMANLREASTTEQMAVRKARAALEEAESKLKFLKFWRREFDSRVEPLVKQLEKLHTFLANDSVQANVYLMQLVETLAAYAEAKPFTQASPSSSAKIAAPDSDGPSEPTSAPGDGAGTGNP